MGDQRYLADKDFNSFKATVPIVIRNAMDLSRLTGQSLNALLELKWQHVEAIGLPRNRWSVTVGRIRSSHPKTMPISESLEEVLKACKRMKPDFPRQFVLRLENGLPMSCREFNSVWRLYMRRWVLSGTGRKPFSFADIRMKSLADRQYAGLVFRRRGH